MRNPLGIEGAGGVLSAMGTIADALGTPLLIGAALSSFLLRFSGAGGTERRQLRWLAYASTESGAMEVYVRPFPATASAKWQVSTVGGAEPVWASSGRELFYINGKSELVSAEIPAGATFSVGRQRVLFSVAQFSRSGPADAEDVGERDLEPLLAGDVDAGNTCHGNSSSALTLLVTWIFTDHPHAAVPTDDLALLTDFLDARTNLHGDLYLYRYVIRPRVRS